MKSKPVYETLSMDLSARRHLFVAEGAGVTCVAKALAADGGNPPVRVVCLGTPVWSEIRRNISVCVFDSGDELNSALTLELAAASMDTAVYVAGRERFLWDIYGVLLREGVSAIRIRMEPAGSASRKVYCVHCSTLNVDVTDSIHVCSGCRSHLFVRDHFSRSMGAYMGVQVDAELPGEVPTPQRLYA
jgi:dimethylamine monooxygenase subunit C